MAKEVKQWITINGQHVPIFEGESKDDAFKRATKRQQENVKKNEDDKEKQIAKNKAEKDQMNKKDSGKILEQANAYIEERDRVIEKYGFNSPQYKALKEEMKKFVDENKVESNRKDEFKAGNIWNGKGHHSNIYKEMQKDNWQWSTKKASNTAREYYRYYNDGDMPSWSRYYNYSSYRLNKQGKRENYLTQKGLDELERRANEMIEKEYSIYKKSKKK